MHKPIVHIVITVALLAVGAFFAGATYVQGRNSLASAAEASALSVALSVASACTSSAADAYTASAPANATVTFSQLVSIAAGGMSVAVTVAGAQGTQATANVTLAAPAGAVVQVSIAPFSGTVKWMAATGYPNGTVVLRGG